MSERKVVVPDGMLKAAKHAFFDPAKALREAPDSECLTAGLESALRWLLEVGIDEKAIRDYCDKEFGGYDGTSERIGFRMGINYVRDMFRSPEPKVNPQKCPHRWQARNEVATNERVIFCELCDWVHSRQAIEKLNW